MTVEEYLEAFPDYLGIMTYLEGFERANDFRGTGINLDELERFSVAKALFLTLFMDVEDVEINISEPDLHEKTCGGYAAIVKGLEQEIEERFTGERLKFLEILLQCVDCFSVHSSEDEHLVELEFSFDIQGVVTK